MTLAERIPWPLTSLHRSAPRYLVLRRGTTRLRVLLPSSADRPATVYLDQATDMPGAALLREAVEAAHHACSARCEVVTQALSPAQAQIFVDAGGSILQHLVVLRLDWAQVDRSRANRRPTTRRPNLRRARVGDLAAAEYIDQRAFGVAWAFDRAALLDAYRVTADGRFRVALDERRAVVAFAVSGRSNEHGYLQRLAVDPAHAGRGIGGQLVADSIGWFERGGCDDVTVNTRPDNARALALYETFGFRRVEPGLVQVSLGELA